MQIAEQGYLPAPSYQTVPSSMPFFPLFPMTVRALTLLLPAAARQPETTAYIGVVFANAAFVAGLYVLHKLIVYHFDRTAAQRAVLYVLTFPTAFFFSCFYPESLLLATTTWACWLATRHNWLAACLVAALAALSRPYGIVVSLPIAWFYMNARAWKPNAIRFDVLYLLLPLAALLAYFLAVKPQTGDLLGPLHAQAAWQRHVSTPWHTFFSDPGTAGEISRVQQCMVPVVLGLSIYGFWRLPSKVYAIYALAMFVPTLCAGSLTSIGRHAALVFPIYMVLATLNLGERGHQALQVLGLTVQVLFMAMWARFYLIF
jgi:hypothetical protein